MFPKVSLLLRSAEGFNLPRGVKENHFLNKPEIFPLFLIREFQFFYLGGEKKLVKIWWQELGF